MLCIRIMYDTSYFEPGLPSLCFPFCQMRKKDWSARLWELCVTEGFPAQTWTNTERGALHHGLPLLRSGQQHNLVKWYFQFSPLGSVIHVHVMTPDMTHTWHYSIKILIKWNTFNDLIILLAVQICLELCVSRYLVTNEYLHWWMKTVN